MSVVESSVLNSPAQYLKGIGPRRAKALEKLGYRTLSDLFYLFPRRYEDRTRMKKISELVEGEYSLVQGRVLVTGVRYFNGKGHFQMMLGDETGIVQLLWFNQPYLKRLFEKDDTLIIYGRSGRFGKRFQFSNPEYEKVTEETDTRIHSSRITPIYPLVSGLYQRGLRQSLWNLIESRLGLLQEYLPESVRSRGRFIPLQEAVKNIHFPDSFEALREAKRRLIFDEFFLFEARLFERIQRVKKDASAYPMPRAALAVTDFVKQLPFQLTRSQEEAMAEIAKDLGGSSPMTRLLQGDVGSGKTVVAASAILASAAAGIQSVFLAPTETLAEQHFLTLKDRLGAFLEDRMALLTGSLAEAEKTRIRKLLGTGEFLFAVGTHALLQDTVEFKNLGFVVIDEQHKFGVRQRAKLLQRALRPHVLLMTATPIPRTLAMTLYGDLNCVFLRELPAGRHPIHTRWFSKKDEAKIVETLQKHLAQGEQGYIVYPAIEETGMSNRVSCEADFERIQKLFPAHPAALIHGRLETALRSERMERFREGKIQILVSTSVIEVGIDNPKATFMVIQGAEYFGLTQLHQLRGRVGRGTRPSVCFLIGDAASEEAKARFEVLQATQDGFKIAEEDLRLRGPGDFLGVRQSGLPLFKLANLITDQELLEEARQAAHQLLEKDPELEGEPVLCERLRSYETEFCD